MGSSEESSMKQLVRRAGKRLLELAESVLGVGPYRRIRHLEATVRKRDEQVQRWQARSRARKVENEQLRKRLEKAVDRRKELELILRSTAEGRSSGSTGGDENRERPPSAKELLHTAWSGWWDLARDQLLEVAGDGDETPRRRYQSYIALAELSRGESDQQAELDYLYRAARVRLPKPPGAALLLQMSYLRMLTGDVTSGERLLDWVPEDGHLVERALLTANARQGGGASGSDAGPSTEPFQQALNAVFESFRLTTVTAIESPSLQSLPRMRAPVQATFRAGCPSVTVIVPAFNCEATLAVTLDSLVRQDWPNVEILVVDDSSSDDTLQVAEEYERADGRVKVLAHGENRGAYAARNTALQQAQGRYITVCDAGDWAHPERIRLQVSDLLASGSLVNWSQWVRCDARLRFHPRTRGLGRFVHDNPSSLMFDRAVFAACGEWDDIRVSGDTEFRMRVQRLMKVIPRRVLEGCPLTIGILEDASLTQAHDTRHRSLYRGVRHEYLQSVFAARNHAGLEARQRSLKSARRSPLVVRPPKIRVSGRSSIASSFALVFVADFSESSCESSPLIEIAAAAARRGRRVGLVHLPGSVGELRAPSLWSRVRVSEIGADWVAPGESAASRLIVTTDSLPLYKGRPIDEFPSIDFGEVWAIVRSRRRPHGFQSVPEALLRDALAAYFGASTRARYLRDTTWPTDASVGGGVQRLEGVRQLNGTLEQWLTKRLRRPSAFGARSEVGFVDDGAPVRLLGCRSCSEEWQMGAPSLDSVSAEAKREGVFIEVPRHLAPSMGTMHDASRTGALTLEPDSDYNMPDREPSAYQAARGLYLAASEGGTGYCWEPMMGTALGHDVVVLDEEVVRANGVRDPRVGRDGHPLAAGSLLHSL